MSESNVSDRNRGARQPILVLVGPPGAGKTTVGRLLAGRLGVPFLDADQDIEKAAGKSVAEIFLDDGEETFRAREIQAVATALSRHPGVLALGGGAVLSPVTRSRLAGHQVAYLRVGFAGAVARVGLSKDRPVLALNPRATLRHLLEQRRPLYEEVATMTVDTDDRSPQEVANDLLSLLHRRGAAVSDAGLADASDAGKADAVAADPGQGNPA